MACGAGGCVAHVTVSPFFDVLHRELRFLRDTQEGVCTCSFVVQFLSCGQEKIVLSTLSLLCVIGKERSVFFARKRKQQKNTVWGSVTLCEHVDEGSSMSGTIDNLQQGVKESPESIVDNAGAACTLHPTRSHIRLLECITSARCRSKGDRHPKRHCPGKAPRELRT